MYFPGPRDPPSRGKDGDSKRSMPSISRSQFEKLPCNPLGYFWGYKGIMEKKVEATIGL